jgi:hypothetical protein
MEDGEVWMAADIILGKAKFKKRPEGYIPPPPVVMKNPPGKVRIPRESGRHGGYGMPQGPIQGVVNVGGPQVCGRDGGDGEVRGPTAVSNDSAESSLNDFISSSGYPRRSVGQSQQFPPAPALPGPAIVPIRRTSYAGGIVPSLPTDAVRTSTQAPSSIPPPLPPQNTATQPTRTSDTSIVTQERESVQMGSSDLAAPKINEPQIQQQSGPWEFCDAIYPPRSGFLTSESAIEGLYKYITQHLPASSATLRNQRISWSQAYYFTSTPLANTLSSSLQETMMSILDVFHHLSIPVTTLDQVFLFRVVVTGELTPYAAIRQDLHENLMLLNRSFPILGGLGLRPLGEVRFMHGDVGVLIFVASEDNVLWLWSREWDDEFGGMMLVRAEGTIEECEKGIVKGLHVLEFERGGWLKIYGSESNDVGEADGMAFNDDEIYGDVPENATFQM